MGFFSFDFDHAKGQIQISDQAWIWFAFTLPLTVFTLGLSYVWIWLKDPNRQNHVSSANDNAGSSRKSEILISRNTSASNIATEEVENVAKFPEYLEQAKKRKSKGPKSLRSIPLSKHESECRAVLAKKNS
jgi:hypothetical protein